MKLFSFKYLKKAFFFVIIFPLMLIFFCDGMIIFQAKNFIFSDISSLPKTKVGLVLGTSKYIADGRRNLFYVYRMDAAKNLYDAGKIDYILVSGDNGNVEYNETDTMKNDLIAMGIPEEKIYGDYAGFRTLDSIIRAKEVFGQESYIIISQRFHLERAIFLAHHAGIDALGFAAQDVPVKLAPRVWIRERLARVKMLFDIIFGTQPKFLGEKIEIGKK